ncbi:hypothetical protein DEO72_LG2g1556 [Vigna unguiculata]|uniref:Uncharacterized protein n=1 Tax=Vigna unguiculata TaxID=3917 RepID=A0A4D6L0A9_VIGUN|nr:hypothetical protein DEO72_LG2g1556 [Vigna unguiculata]
MLDTTEIIDWFLGISCRWLKWYENCANFDESHLFSPVSVQGSILTMTKRGSIIMYFPTDKQQFETQPHSVTYSPDNGHTVGKSTLVMNIASLLE